MQIYKKEKKMEIETKRLMVTLPIQTLDRLDRLVEEKGLKKSVIITLALEEYEKNYGKEKGNRNE